MDIKNLSTLKVFRQMAAYPNYDILRNVSGLPTDLCGEKLYKLANFIEENFQSQLKVSTHLKYNDVINKIQEAKNKEKVYCQEL